VRAEALGFQSAWVVEQILGSIQSLEPVTLLTYRGGVHGAAAARLRGPAHRAAEPGPSRQEPRDARPPERGAPDRRGRARRQPADLPGVRSDRGATRGAFCLKTPANEASEHAVARHVRGT